MNKELADELKEISSGRLPRKEGKVPDGYFEHLPEQVLKRWNQQVNKETQGIFRLQKMIAAAAVVSGICFAVALFSPANERDHYSREITTAEAYDYIMDHIEEFDLLLEEPLGLTEQNDFQILEPDVIEDYLLEELDGADVEQIF